MKNILILTLCLISTVVNAQFFGKIIEDRISSGANGNYLFLIDEEFMMQNGGRFPELYESGKYFLIERSEGDEGFQVIDTLRPIRTREEFEFLFEKGSMELMLADSSGFNFASEEELLNAYSSANNPQFGRLFFLKPLEQLRATGHAYLDTQVEKGKQYTYKVRWGDTGKVIFTDSVIAGKENSILKQTKLNFNQMSIKAIDSLITGTWLSENMTDIMPYKVNFYGKETFDSEFRKIGTKRVEYTQDMLAVTLSHRVNGPQVWDAFAVPVDLLGNEGTPSDTVTLAAFSKARLPFPKNFTAKDSADGIHLTWNPVLGHSYVGGYLLSKEIASQVFEVIDTVAANVSEYIDYDVESGSGYNYEIQVLSNPIGNLAIQDFPAVRASGNHLANERLLPPEKFTLTQEGKYIKISWDRPEDPNVLAVYVYSSLSGNADQFGTVGNASEVNYLIDSTDNEDFQHLTRYYALKSMGYNLKLSQLSNVRSIRPIVEKVLSRPIGLIIRTWPDYNKLEWQTDAASENFIDYFNVYRREVGEENYTLLATNVSISEYLDISAANKLIYEYQVTAVNLNGAESTPSVSSQNNKRILKSNFKPKGVAKVSVNNIPPGIQIAWLLAENHSNSAIKVYRMNLASEDTYTEIASVDVSNSRYWDTTAVVGEAYAYCIATITDQGAESEKGFMKVIDRVEITE